MTPLTLVRFCGRVPNGTSAAGRCEHEAQVRFCVGGEGGVGSDPIWIRPA